MSTQPFADKAWTVREVANGLGDRAIVKVRRRVIDPRGAAPTDINVILDFWNEVDPGPGTMDRRS
jgi:hypothetical protein